MLKLAFSLKKSMLRKTDAVFLAIFIVIVFSTYMLILNRFPLLYGIDGPYYLIQLEYIARYGRMKYADPPLAFYLFYLFTLIFGDPTFSIRLALSLTIALSAIPLYLMLRIHGFNTVSIFLTMFIYYFSTGLLRLTGDFLKNATGLIFVTLTILFTSMYVKRGGKIYLVLALASVALAGLTHILDFGLSLSYLILYPLLGLKTEDKSRCYKLIFAGVAFTVALVLAGLALYPDFFADVFKGEALVKEIVEMERTEFEAFLRNKFILSFLPADFACLAFIIYYAYKGKLNDIPNLALLASSLAIGLGLTLPIIPTNFLWRFALVQFYQGSIVIGGIFSRLRVEKALALTLLVIVASPYVIDFYFGRNMVRPIISMKDYHDLEHLISQVPEGSTVIAMTHAFYWVEYIALKKNIDVIRGGKKIEPQPALYFIVETTRMKKPPPGKIVASYGRFILIKR